MNNSTKYLLLSFITFIGGYIYLRFAYNATSDIPFVQEIVLVVLGTIVTIAITAALLNKQSEVELEKEQRVKVFDLKSELYFDLIEFIETLLKKSEISDRDMTTLEFLTHKISIIANPAVLKSYNEFLKVVKKTGKDKIINTLESDELSEELARLCSEIRYDLMPKGEQKVDDIKKVILGNIRKINE